MQAKYIGSEAGSARAVVYGGVVYLPAIVAEDDSLSPAEQTIAILKSIDKILEESGTSKKRMLAASLFYADTRVVDEVNGRWDAWVPWHDPPACNFLVTKLSGARKRVAIQVTAAL